MDDTTLKWLIGGSFAFTAGCYAWQWLHRNDCEQKRLRNESRFTVLEKDSGYLLDEVGRGHNEGLRGRMHFVENRVNNKSQVER